MLNLVPFERKHLNEMLLFWQIYLDLSNINFARPKIENMQMGGKRFSHEKEVTVRPIDILVAVCKCKVLHKLSSTNLKVLELLI